MDKEMLTKLEQVTKIGMLLSLGIAAFCFGIYLANLFMGILLK